MKRISRTLYIRVSNFIYVDSVFHFFQPANFKLAITPFQPVNFAACLRCFGNIYLVEM
jgi:hypothetical protein